MKIKLFDDSILEESMGFPILEYLKDRPDIKQYFEDEWKDNPNFNLENKKQIIINSIKKDNSFRIDLLIYGIIDDLIASEANLKIKAVYTLLKQDAINSLIEYKQKIIDNS